MGSSEGPEAPPKNGCSHRMPPAKALETLLLGRQPTSTAAVYPQRDTTAARQPREDSDAKRKEFSLMLLSWVFFLAPLDLHCSAQASLVAAHGLSCSMWDLSSLTRDQTRDPCIGSADS